MNVKENQYCYDLEYARCILVPSGLLTPLALPHMGTLALILENSVYSLLNLIIALYLSPLYPPL